MHDSVLIVDYGSQFTQLIARRVREQGVYCEIHPPTRSVEWIRDWGPKGVILSGGPASVYGDEVPTLDPDLLDIGVPVLGICYGMQLIAHVSGGSVVHGTREYGRAELRVNEGSSPLFAGFEPDDGVQVWCSHGDHIDTPPPGFETTASTNTLPVAAFEAQGRPVYGVQFHPEVAHSLRGDEIVANFLFKICGCEATWTPAAFIESHIETIRAQVGDAQVICGLSGGVDSSVAAALVLRALGDRLTCVFVDNGLLRHKEREEVESTFRKSMGFKLIVEDASDSFIANLAGIVDPERKRKVIGETFIRVFEAVCDREVQDAKFLVQGTLYPDVIESLSAGGPSATIKTHHNVGGLPDDMRFELIEPLRELLRMK